MGELFFQLKRSYAGFSRECDVNENASISDLIGRIHCKFHQTPEVIVTHSAQTASLPRILSCPKICFTDSTFDGNCSCLRKIQ